MEQGHAVREAERGAPNLNNSVCSSLCLGPSGAIGLKRESAGMVRTSASAREEGGRPVVSKWSDHVSGGLVLATRNRNGSGKRLGET